MNYYITTDWPRYLWECQADANSSRILFFQPWNHVFSFELTGSFNLQVIFSFWEMSVLLNFVKIIIAGAFGFNINKKITEERSTLRREFYNKFAKVGVNINISTCF